MKKETKITLIEVIALIFFLLLLLLIAPLFLNKFGSSSRVVCGTNLKGLGNAMIVYASDFDGQYPCQGMNADHTWADATDQWMRIHNDWKQRDNITVGASLYLLVRLADVSPKSFVCPYSDQAEFSGKNPDNLDIVDLWDFGQNTADPAGRWKAEGPARCVSYSYHQPYDPAAPATGRPGRFRANDLRSADFAIAADRSPYYDPKLAFTDSETLPRKPEKWVSPLADHWKQVDTAEAAQAVRERIKLANSQPHERQGQNVLFADGHSSFEKTPDVGVKNDNIYTRIDADDPKLKWTDPIRWRCGRGPQRPDRNGEDETPATDEDSFLVNDFITTVR